jgi:hypothetical protein
VILTFWRHVGNLWYFHVKTFPEGGIVDLFMVHNIQLLKKEMKAKYIKLLGMQKQNEM